MQWHFIKKSESDLGFCLYSWVCPSNPFILKQLTAEFTSYLILLCIKPDIIR